jgi:hypothetical protein
MLPESASKFDTTETEKAAPEATYSQSAFEFATLMQLESGTPASGEVRTTTILAGEVPQGVELPKPISGNPAVGMLEMDARASMLMAAPPLVKVSGVDFIVRIGVPVEGVVVTFRTTERASVATFPASSWAVMRPEVGMAVTFPVMAAIPCFPGEKVNPNWVAGVAEIKEMD